MNQKTAKSAGSKGEVGSQEATLVLQGRKLDQLRRDVAGLQQSRQKKRWLGFLVWSLAGAAACSLGIMGAMRLQDSVIRVTEAPQSQKAPPHKIRSVLPEPQLEASPAPTSQKKAIEPSAETSRASEESQGSTAASRSENEKAVIETVRFDDVAD